jgi:hypothetical protein
MHTADKRTEAQDGVMRATNPDIAAELVQLLGD